MATRKINGIITGTASLANSADSDIVTIDLDDIDGAIFDNGTISLTAEIVQVKFSNYFSRGKFDAVFSRNGGTITQEDTGGSSILNPGGMTLTFPNSGSTVSLNVENISGASADFFAKIHYFGYQPA